MTNTTQDLRDLESQPLLKNHNNAAAAATDDVGSGNDCDDDNMKFKHGPLTALILYSKHKSKKIIFVAFVFLCSCVVVVLARTRDGMTGVRGGTTQSRTFAFLGNNNNNNNDDDSNNDHSFLKQHPDEDELTKEERDKIDFFLEERRKELVIEAISKHASEEEEESTTNSDDTKSTITAAANNNNNNNNNSNNKKSSATPAAAADNSNNSNNSNNNNNGAKKDSSISTYANNKKVANVGDKDESGANGNNNSNNNNNNNNNNKQNNNNDNNKSKDEKGGDVSSPPSSDAGNDKQKQQQQHQKQQQQVVTDNVQVGKNVDNIVKDITSTAVDGVKELSKDIIENNDELLFLDSNDENYKPNPVSPVQFLANPKNNARCLDGSPLAYYVSKRLDRSVKMRECTSDSVHNSCGETWVIMLSGGGTCVNGEGCTRRAATGLGTSKLVPRTYHFSSGLQSVLKNNQAFNMANMVNIAYCSGDSWLGRSNKPDAFGLTTSGGLIVDAILEELIDNHDLLSARHILFAGKSAGGIGLVAQIDRWADTISSSYEKKGYSKKLQPPKVSAVVFAGFHYFHTHTFYDPRDQMSIDQNENADDDVKDEDKEEAGKGKSGEDFEPKEFDRMVEKILVEQNIGTTNASDKEGGLANASETATLAAAAGNKKEKTDGGDSNSNLLTGLFGIFGSHHGKIKNLDDEDVSSLGANENENVKDDDDKDDKADEDVFLNSAESRLVLKYGLNTDSTLKPSFVPWDETSWKKYLKFWHAEQSLPNSCVNQQRKAPSRCAVARNSVKYIKTPIFFVQSLTDSVVMAIHDNWPLADHTFVHAPDLSALNNNNNSASNDSMKESREKMQELVDKTIDDLASGKLDMKAYEDKQIEQSEKMWTSFSKDERVRREKYARVWKKQMSDRLYEASKENPNVGVFAPSCYVHTKFDKIKINDIEAREALSHWLFEGEKTVIVDSCDDVFCNPTCKDSAPNLQSTKEVDAAFTANVVETSKAFSKATY